ncbi:MAG TPA: hypothetical protein VJY12_10130 [Dysgonamonadaceae bacterium]|nr:hypothetical protein [Dysgonamonadaceae bacterium]
MLSFIVVAVLILMVLQLIEFVAAFQSVSQLTDWKVQYKHNPTFSTKFMKHRTLIYMLILILSSSCATLNISEIKNIEKTSFDALSLNPGKETNDLRIDLIRRTNQESVNDSTNKIEETPYHPIGFDLGNGLFYDLNENLCLKIDYLLGYSSDEDFEIQITNRPKKNKGQTIYKFHSDTLTKVNLQNEKSHYLYHRVQDSDSISYMYKKRMKYALIENDSSMIYSGKRRYWDVIHKLNENEYFLNKKRRKENYRITENEIFLEKDYIVCLSNSNKTIEIKRQGKRRHKILYTIEKSNEKTYIYSPKYNGLKIERIENSMLIYRDKTLLAKYELK